MTPFSLSPHLPTASVCNKHVYEWVSVHKRVTDGVIFSQDPLPLFFFFSKQAQKDELKVAKGQAAEGAKERLRWEEVEKENSRLKKEMASLPVLQKENQRMKRELESVPALQKELETLRATVTESKHSPGTNGQREEVGRGCG